MVVTGRDMATDVVIIFTRSQFWWAVFPPPPVEMLSETEPIWRRPDRTGLVQFPRYKLTIKNLRNSRA